LGWVGLETKRCKVKLSAEKNEIQTDAHTNQKCTLDRGRSNP